MEVGYIEAVKIDMLEVREGKAESRVQTSMVVRLVDVVNNVACRIDFP